MQVVDKKTVDQEDLETMKVIFYERQALGEVMQKGGINPVVQSCFNELNQEMHQKGLILVSKYFGNQYVNNDAYSWRMDFATEAIYLEKQ